MSTSTRINELDSLRGIAALAVFILHLKLIFPDNTLSDIITFSPLRIFIAGQEAVILFFVLSGFVLSLPYHNGKNIPYSKYLTRRICRIYIPYIVAVALSITAKQALYNGKIPTLNAWFNSFWWQSVTPQVITEHVFMIKAYGSNLNPVLWSLVYEMRLSILFPLIILATRHTSIKTSLFIASSCSVVAILLVLALSPPEIAVDYLYTIHYASMFIIGATVAKYKGWLSERLQALPIKSKYLLITVSMALFLYAYAPFSFAQSQDNVTMFCITVIRSWLVSIGSVVLILLAMTPNMFSAMLNSKPAIFLGKISYSLYLVHFIAFLAILRLLHDKMPLIAVTCISLVAGIAVSAVMYYSVEKPAIRFGKWLSGKV